jgi:3-deoxy-D-manno-octulosonic-acid transferase
MVAGDTRFDRVIAVAEQRKRWSVLDNFTSGHKVYVGGSTWLEDEKYIARALELFPDVKFIVVPHEVNEARIAQIEALMPGKTIRYSLCNDKMLNFPQVIIIDQIGMLNGIYAYATVAHIGNGFGSGIHNTLEAAVYGVPVIFGPNYHKFPEALELINLGAAFSFSSFEMYKRILEKLFYEDLQSIREKARHYVFSQAGATNKILKILENYLRE